MSMKVSIICIILFSATCYSATRPPPPDYDAQAMPPPVPPGYDYDAVPPGSYEADAPSEEEGGKAHIQAAVDYRPPDEARAIPPRPPTDPPVDVAAVPPGVPDLGKAHTQAAVDYQAPDEQAIPPRPPRPPVDVAAVPPGVPDFQSKGHTQAVAPPGDDARPPTDPPMDARPPTDPPADVAAVPPGVPDYLSKAHTQDTGDIVAPPNDDSDAANQPNRTIRGGSTIIIRIDDKAVHTQSVDAIHVRLPPPTNQADADYRPPDEAAPPTSPPMDGMPRMPPIDSATPPTDPAVVVAAVPPGVPDFQIKTAHTQAAAIPPTPDEEAVPPTNPPLDVMPRSMPTLPLEQAIPPREPPVVLAARPPTDPPVVVAAVPPGVPDFQSKGHTQAVAPPGDDARPPTDPPVDVAAVPPGVPDYLSKAHTQAVPPPGDDARPHPPEYDAAMPPPEYDAAMPPPEYDAATPPPDYDSATPPPDYETAKAMPVPPFSPPDRVASIKRHARIQAAPVPVASAVPVGSAKSQFQQQAARQMLLVGVGFVVVLALVALVVVSVYHKRNTRQTSIDYIPSFNAQDPTELV